MSQPTVSKIACFFSHVVLFTLSEYFWRLFESKLNVKRNKEWIKIVWPYNDISKFPLNFFLLLLSNSTKFMFHSMFFTFLWPFASFFQEILFTYLFHLLRRWIKKRIDCYSNFLFQSFEHYMKKDKWMRKEILFVNFSTIVGVYPSAYTSSHQVFWFIKIFHKTKSLWRKTHNHSHLNYIFLKSLRTHPKQP